MDRKPGHLPKDVQGAVDSLIWIKIVGIGNTAVGKTCLIKHFCESKEGRQLEKEFNTGYQPTVGVDYGFKIQDVQGTDVRVHLWDLSGSTEYIDVRNELYGGTDAVFIAYDVTNTSSFDSLDSWLREIRKYATGSPDIVVVANKTDQKQKRAITTSEGRKWASQNKVKYHEASACTGEGVVSLFTDMLEGIVARRTSGKDNSAHSRKWDSRKLAELCSPVPFRERGKSARN